MTRLRTFANAAAGVSFAILVAATIALSAPAPAAAMNNPGPFPLQLNGGDFSITAAGTLTPNAPSTGFAGINALACQVRFAYGSGGSNVTAYIQTSLDSGQSWIDIMAIQFTTSGGVQILNVSALDKVTSPVTPTDGALSPGTVVDGILGDQFRAKVISTGTYAGGSLLSVRCQAR